MHLLVRHAGCLALTMTEEWEYYFYYLKSRRDRKMQQRKTLICLFIFYLLMVWISPVGYVQAARAVNKDIININSASLEELKQLPRIGQKVAERIIHYRETHGLFKKTEDLKGVRGIGDKNFEKIRKLICIK